MDQRLGSIGSRWRPTLVDSPPCQWSSARCLLKSFLIFWSRWRRDVQTDREEDADDSDDTDDSDDADDIESGKESSVLRDVAEDELEQVELIMEGISDEIFNLEVIIDSDNSLNPSQLCLTPSDLIESSPAHSVLISSSLFSFDCDSIQFAI